QLGVALNDGTNLGSTVTGSLLYTSTLTSLSPFIASVAPIFTPDDFAWALVDANGDGLADLVRNHLPRTPTGGGGQLLINSGENWLDPNGVTSWQVPVTGNPVPVVPDPRLLKNGSTFVDLNGDGLPDLIQEGIFGGTPSRAWLNGFQQPVIIGFPNGLAN